MKRLVRSLFVWLYYDELMEMAKRLRNGPKSVSDADHMIGMMDALERLDLLL
jgi:hypothetical protein